MAQGEEQLINRVDSLRATSIFFPVDGQAVHGYELSGCIHHERFVLKIDGHAVYNSRTGPLELLLAHLEQGVKVAVIQNYLAKILHVGVSIDIPFLLPLGGDSLGRSQGV